MSRGLLQLSMVILLVYAWQAFSPAQLGAQQRSTSKSTASNNGLEGKRIFASTCAACHGLDGSGGERGPDLHRREIQLRSDKALIGIVQEGIPGTGMPAFRSLGRSRIQAVVRHLRNLQGQGGAGELVGDPEPGKALFFGKAECSQCHMLNGEGGFIGSDLSNYASAQSADEIRSAISDPNKNLDPRKRTVIVRTTDGKTQTGVARNEDNFSLQLQTIDGTFHFFTKSGVQSIEYQNRSMMPADYKSRLSSQEIDDIVGYLISIGRSNHRLHHMEKE
jgi:cytochrome c oxidase cbb3-type subunit 3